MEKKEQKKEQKEDTNCSLKKQILTNSYSVLSLALLPNQNIVVGSDTLTIWNADNYEKVQTVRDEDSFFFFRKIEIMDQNTIAVSGDDNQIRIFDLKKSQCTKKWKAHDFEVSDLKQYAESKNLLLSTSLDDTMKLWDLDTSKCLKEFVGHSQGVFSCIWMGDNTIVSVGGDLMIKVWDEITGKCQKTIKTQHRFAVEKVIRLPKLGERIIATGSFDNTIEIWDVDKGTMLKSLEGHEKSISCLSFFPSTNSGILVSASADATMKVWDTKTGCCIAHTNAHNEKVNDLLVLRNGGIVTCSNDGAVKVWTFRNIEDDEERFQYLLETEFFDFELKFKNTTFKCFKSLLCTSKLDISETAKEIQIDEEILVDNEVFLRILFGKDFEVDEEKKENLEIIFQKLKLEQYKGKFIPAIDEEKVKMIEESKKKVKADTKDSEEKKKETLAELDQQLYQLKNPKIEKVLNFHDIFIENLKELRKANKYYNLTFVTNDGTKHPVHREILIFRLNSIHLMHKFPGLESNSKEIKLVNKFMNRPDQLHSLLKYVYNGKIFDPSIETLMNLLSYSLMYFEKEFKDYLVRTIKQLFTVLDQNDSVKFREMMIIYGHLFDSEEMLGLFMNYWVKQTGFSEIKINRMIQQSCDAVIITEQKREIDRLKERIKLMEKSMNKE